MGIGGYCGGLVLHPGMAATPDGRVYLNKAGLSGWGQGRQPRREGDRQEGIEPLVIQARMTVGRFRQVNSRSSHDTSRMLVVRTDHRVKIP